MPLRKKSLSDISSSSSSSYSDLHERLTQEWRRPRSDTKQPAIIEEEQAKDQPVHLYVVWDDWADLDQETRSGIIMDVYEKVRGVEASMLVTVAMGLTAAEARRMNIDWE